MRFAIVLAGGVGKRMGANVPKQFLSVDGKPVLAFTLEAFQRHANIDAIEVVCVEGYEDAVKEIVEKYGITKFKWTAKGGETCQESIRNGLYNLEDVVSEDDTVIIHLASYPMIDEESITSCYEVAEAHPGSSSAAAAPVDTLTFCTDDGVCSNAYYPREKLKVITSPLGYNYGDVLALYKQAYAEGKGIEGTVYSDTLYIDYGKGVYFSKAPKYNVKITRPEDIDMFKAVLALNEKGNN
jgi:2-C-methyl-D-erythritol 4-phosphate cytidylyltransferase